MKKFALFCLAAFILAATACAPEVSLSIPSATNSSSPLYPTPSFTPIPSPTLTPTPVPLAPEYMEQTIDQVLDYSVLLAEINAERKAAIEADTFVDMSGFLEPYDDTLKLLSSSEIEMLLTQPEKSTAGLSKEKAIEDIDYLFKLIKCGYGPYFYFGGDETFSAAKESLISSLPDGYLAKSSFIDLIAKSLAFIKDDHFDIDQESIIHLNYGYSFWYISKEQYFSRDEQGWYKLYGNEKWRVVDITIPEGKSYRFVPTIDDRGRIVYTLGVLNTGIDASIDASLTLTNAGRSFMENVTLSVMRAGYRDAASQLLFSFDTFEKFSLLELRGFREYACAYGKSASLESYVTSGKVARDAALLLMDLRGNRGGYSHYYERWFKNYLGKNAISKCFSAQRFSKLPHPTATGRAGKWDIWENERGKWVEMESARVILIDKDIGSSGEGYIYALRTLSNTLFVGSNTLGCALTGNAVECYLPNSGICIEIPMGFKFNETTDCIDGRGIDPDIWVMPNEALDRTLKMLEYYGIED